MHVNKANRGRQGQQKKATEKERDGGKTSKPDGSGVRWVRGWGGACEGVSGLRLRLGGPSKGGLLRTRSRARRLGKAGPGGGGCGDGRVGESHGEDAGGGMMERDRAWGRATEGS